MARIIEKILVLFSVLMLITTSPVAALPIDDIVEELPVDPMTSAVEDAGGAVVETVDDVDQVTDVNGEEVKGLEEGGFDLVEKASPGEVKCLIKKPVSIGSLLEIVKGELDD